MPQQMCPPACVCVCKCSTAKESTQAMAYAREPCDGIRKNACTHVSASGSAHFNQSVPSFPPSTKQAPHATHVEYAVGLTQSAYTSFQRGIHRGAVCVVWVCVCFFAQLLVSDLVPPTRRVIGGSLTFKPLLASWRRCGRSLSRK